MSVLFRWQLALSVAMAVALAFPACKAPESTQVDAAAAPESLIGQECAACGMTVSAQAAPRGQAVHRDGTHAFFCSIADMITYLGAPSPHGAAVAAFVEALPPDVDHEVLVTVPYPWIPAESASFVYGGFERPVMGRPFLTFQYEPLAQEVAARLHGQVASWDEVLTLVP